MQAKSANSCDSKADVFTVVNSELSEHSTDTCSLYIYSLENVQVINSGICDIGNILLLHLHVHMFKEVLATRHLCSCRIIHMY